VSEFDRRLQGTIEADALVEQWFESEEAYLHAAASPEAAAAWADVGNYAKTDGTFWVVRDHVIIPPPVMR
jgi:hypothetical protein